MKRAALVGATIAVVLGCSCRAVRRDGPTSLSERESRALLAATGGRPGGLERFWIRPGFRPGLVKWAGDRSRVVAGAPGTLLGLVRDEIGRLNRVPAAGEVVFVTVTVFEWTRRMFGRPAYVGYEIVGRDRVGQVLWLGLDRMYVPRELARDLAESDELLVAREIGRRLRLELAR